MLSANQRIHVGTSNILGAERGYHLGQIGLWGHKVGALTALGLFGNGKRTKQEMQKNDKQKKTNKQKQTNKKQTTTTNNTHKHTHTHTHKTRRTTPKKAWPANSNSQSGSNANLSSFLRKPFFGDTQVSVCF